MGQTAYWQVNKSDVPELFVELLQLSLNMAIFLLVTTYGALQHLVIILMSCQGQRGATITSLAHG